MTDKKLEMPKIFPLTTGKGWMDAEQVLSYLKEFETWIRSDERKRCVKAVEGCMFPVRLRDVDVLYKAVTAIRSLEEKQ